MSYILGALRKAEQESKRRSKSEDDPMDSADWNAPQPSSGATRGFKIAVFVAVVLFLIVFVLIWLMLDKLSESSGSAFGGNSLDDSASANIQEVAPSVESDADTSVPAFQAELPGKPQRESKAQNEEVELPIITGHLYFPANEALSRLFGETGSYRVGHVFENGLKLVSITEVQAIFEKEGYRYEMPLDN